MFLYIYDTHAYTVLVYNNKQNIMEAHFCHGIIQKCNCNYFSCNCNLYLKISQKCKI